MRFLASLLCLILCALSQTSAAQHIVPSHASLAGTEIEPVARTRASVSNFSKEPYVIEKYTTNFRFESDGSQTRTIFARVRIQSDLAAQKFSQLAFNYDSSNGSLHFQFVRIIRPEQPPLAISISSSKDAPAEVTEGAAAYENYRQKSISISGLQTGDILEYEVVSRTHSQPAGEFWMQHTFLTDAIVLSETLEVEVSSSRHVTLKSLKLPYATDTQTAAGQVTYRWNHDNLVLSPEQESDATQPTSKPPDVSLTSFSNWNELASWYAALTNSKAIAPEVRAKAAELTQNRANDLDKIRSIYDYVSQQIHYVDLPFAPGTIAAISATQVISGGRGSGADKEMLLAALLNAAGISGETALIASGGFDPTLPSPAQFSRVLAVTHYEGRTLWLDPSSGVAPFEYLPPSAREKSALLLSSKKLTETPPDPPFRSTQQVEIDGQVSDLGKLTARIRYQLRGDNEFVLRLAFHRTPESQWKQLAQTMLALDGLHGDVLAVKPANPTSTETPFALEIDYAQAGFIDFSAQRLAVPLPLLAIGMPEAPKESSKPIELGNPLRVDAQLRLTFPQNITVRAPVAIAVSQDYAGFKSQYQFDGHVLSAQRDLEFKARSVPSDHVADYLAFSHAVAADQSQPLLVENSAAGAVPADARVAELYEAGAAALSSGNTRAAIPLFERVVKDEPAHPQAWTQLGLAYMRAQKLEPAATAFQKQLALNPADPQANNYLGLVLDEQHKYDDAIAAFRKQIAIDPLDKIAHEALGNIYLSQHEYSQALTELDKAAVLSPDKASLQISLGGAYLNLGQNTQAVAALDKAAALSHSPAALNAIARELADHQIELAKAQKYAQSAVDAVSNIQADFAHLSQEQIRQEAQLADYWDTLGWVYFQKAELGIAQRYIRASWLLNPSGESAFHLGRVYEKLSNKEEAIRTYAKALAAPDPDPEAQARLTLLLGGNSQIPDLLVRTKAGPASDATFRVSNPTKAEGSADFLIALSASASVDATQATTVRFLTGTESLRPFAERLRGINFGPMFPVRSSQKLVRSGRLECVAGSNECRFTLLPLIQAEPTPAQ